MKNLMMVFTCLTIFMLSFTSCKKDDCDLAELNPTCQDSVPTNQLCQAAFQRWFYDSAKNTCEEIGYSGCEPYGFATQEDCEACQCN